MNTKSRTESAVLSLLLISVFSLLFFPNLHGRSTLAAYGLWILFVGWIGFQILRTGQISRWRSVLFIVMAWGFLLHFKATLLGLRGNAFFTPDIQEVPYCHIAIVSSFLNAVYQQYLALQSGRWHLWGPLSLGVLWVAVTLVIGQAWCAWGCFYGGLDEGFSRLARRPLWRRFHLPARWRDLPAAILLFSVLVSLGSMLPIFCLWMCPLKISTAFLDPGGPTRWMQMALFTSIGAAAVVILPFLLKKRVFCGLICPFGAWQAFFGRIHPVRVTISPDLCTACGECVRVCPTFVLDSKATKEHQVSSYCNRCGECMDHCPEGAIQFTLMGHPSPCAGDSRWAPFMEIRTWFVFACLLVSGTVGALFVPPLLQKWIHAISIMF